MHKVERNETPQELTEKNEYIRNNCENVNVENEWKRFSSSKLKKEVLDSLKYMFNNSCAYCEAIFSDSSYAQIDHFKPKSIYPELCFEYSNMNYSCEKCNNYKSNKFDSKLINPTIDDPEEYLRFKGVYLTALNDRGEKTLEILGLNNEDRIVEKQKGYERIRKKIEILIQLFDNVIENKINIPDEYKNILITNINEIEYYMNPKYSSYSTMYKHNFKECFDYIKCIIEKI